MTKSENINELAAALSKAQAIMGGAVKDSSNPFFKSNYADLASVWEAARKPLADNGLSVVQTMDYQNNTTTLITTLLHSSGQWISGEMPVKAKDDSAQAMGSGISYARRYALSAILGIYQVDDDANQASGKIPQRAFEPKPTPVVTAPSRDPREEIGYGERKPSFNEQVAATKPSNLTYAERAALVKKKP